MSCNEIRLSEDGQTEAGRFCDLERLAVAAVAAGARERFVRELVKRGVGTRVMEDKAGGLSLEHVNAACGFRGMRATGVRCLQTRNRCYRDPVSVVTLVKLLHRRVRAEEKRARQDFLGARARALKSLGPAASGKLLSGIQSARTKAKTERDKHYNQRLQWAVQQAADCQTHRVCSEYRRREGIPGLRRRRITVTVTQQQQPQWQGEEG